MSSKEIELLKRDFEAFAVRHNFDTSELIAFLIEIFLEKENKEDD